MQVLEPLTLPLDQNALIEASAGTGKTYTITTLYLRALLGLVKGKSGDSLTPLSIDQILVVTFTEAATQEIKDRVRTKLQEAQSALIAGEAKDDNLNKLLKEFCQSFVSQYPELSAQDASLYAYHRLQDAITLIDEASIFTIHGFCHRCLKQFAFETNSSFEQTFEMDAKPTLLGALQDFWRKRIAGLQGHEFEWFAQYWTEPDTLYKAIAEVVGKEVHIKPNVQEELYLSLMQRHQSLIEEVKQAWQKDGFTSILAQSGLKKNIKPYKQLLKVNEFVQSASNIMNFGKGDGWHLWGSDSLNKANNFTKGAEPFSHPLVSKIDELAEVENKLRQGHFQAHWIAQAKSYIEQRAGQLKTEAQIINPDDLLTELLVAISSDEEQALTQAIRTTYPLAFIDEFQDTDPVQYGIFSSVYGANIVPNESEQQSPVGKANMILIGDPKQAIYKFRGADIFTYIQAKEDIPPNQHYTLVKNYRSHPNLIKAVNQCFSLSEDSFQHKQIPFVKVGAGKESSKSLQHNGLESSNLTFWHLQPEAEQETEKPKTGFVKGEAESLFARWCATDIYQHLKLANKGELTISGDPVKPQDICVLVRNRHQAGLVKSALSELGISAVFISRDNVFKTALAQDLLRVLIALESPYNELKVRAACASTLFSANVDELIALNQDPQLWQQRLDLFVQAHELWARGKVAPALKVLTDEAETYKNWRSGSATEAGRLITDFRHLVELIQQQAVRKAGSQKLLLWFEQQVLATDNWSDASEEQQLRLESDSDLVQIATLHASKGLEYPIVYLPFITEFKAAQKAIYNSNSEANQGLSYKVDNDGLEMQIAEQERLAEDLRLLYVAMTRPIYKLVLGLVNIQAPRTKKSELAQTALGQLMFSEQIDTELFIDNEQIKNVCEQVQYLVQQQTKESTVEYLPKQEDLVFDEYKRAQLETAQQTSIEDKTELSFTSFSGDVAHNWRMLSYSALAASHHHDSEVWLPGVSDEVPEILTVDRSALAELEPEKSVFTFPKGANAGSCLHWILENLDFTLPVAEQLEAVELGLDRYGFSLDWTSVTVQWMQNVLDTQLLQLAAPIFALNQLSEIHKLVEMEFYFSFEQLSPEILKNALLMSGINTNQFNMTIFEDEQKLAGIIKGFIDLTFTHDGKYYVLDYKSNHLGDNPSDYQAEAMASAMTEHNYQLQALIYTLALHRYLRQRIADYDYNRHIGSSLYLFLRGMCGNDENNLGNTGVYEITFKHDVIEYLDNALLGETSISAENQMKNPTSEPSKAAATTVPFEQKVKTKQKQQVPDKSDQMGFDFD